MMPFIACITVLSDHILAVCLTIILLTFIAIVLCFIRRQTKPIVIKELLDFSPPYGPRLPFLTNLFSTLMTCVCIAILAVDFRIFSRRFAKTEIYGFSLMDVGVGSFIAINGGFSPESRLGGSDPKNKAFLLFKKTFYSTIPLIVLGFQRLIAVKSLEYHEHITEYGLHWNFFFTLGLTKVITFHVLWPLNTLNLYSL
jgi:phosphatidylinositol glycan class W